VSTENVATLDDDDDDDMVVVVTSALWKMLSSARLR
jgi:hypothetical protein